MPRKRSERLFETGQEKWNRRVRAILEPSQPHPDTYEETVEWYTTYLCGVIDTLAVFSDVSYAADAKEVIKETVESIIKDGMVLQAKGR